VKQRSFLLTIALFGFPIVASAQVTPDGSLNTTVRTSNGLDFTIDAGNSAGGNLFHSFREFSIPTGGSAAFNNGANVQNIIGRVTGGNASTIDGLIRANGSANLFLINPQGLIFGANAALDIGGSFIGSTADRIRFADGTELSTTRAQSPLLTISAPTGLQYSANSGAIQVLGRGNRLALNPESFAIVRDSRPVGLQVSSGRTLALVGGAVTLQGGNLTAPSGRIEMGSVRNGWVRLIPTDLAWKLNYAGLDRFNNIQLSNAASIDVSGNGSGNVQLQGRNIRLADGSGILAITEENIPGGTANLRASNAIEIIGTSEETGFPSSIFSDVAQSAIGAGGNVLITAEQLNIRDGAILSVSTLGEGDAGDLSIRVSNLEASNSSGIFADVNQSASGNGGIFSIEANQIRLSSLAQATAGTFGSGKGGRLNVRANVIRLSGNAGFFVSSEGEGQGGTLDVNADRISLRRGGQLTANAVGTGNGGLIRVRAGELEVVGETVDGSNAAAISSQVLEGATGRGGEIRITADRLSIREGAFISSSTFSTGAAGDLILQASDLEVIGVSPSDPRFASSISTGVQREAVGDAGRITITADRLRVAGGARVASATRGNGRGGDLQVTAGQVEISGADPLGNRSSGFTTSVESTGVGNGGDFSLFVDRLLIDQGGEIATRTDGLGNAGDLLIQANEEISLRGRFPNSQPNSQLNSQPNSQLNSRLTASSNSSRAAGTLRISAPRIQLRDRATISVSGESTGTAGNLEVQGGMILLENSQLSAETAAGDRGNITINGGALTLRRESAITTNATADATGGTITLDTDVAVLAEQSEIVAQAVRGEGGNIAINTQGLFLTPGTQIDASSDLGIDGIVRIDTPDIDPSQQLVELPDQVLDASRLIANSCLVPSGRQQGTFVITGTGGLPTLPTNPLRSPFATYSIPANSNTESNAPETQPVVEPTGFYPLENGQIALSRLCS
jgi:filamentous hemagglutinin family protein